MTKEILFEGKYLRLVRKQTWEFVERIHGDGIVVIMPLTEKKTVIVIDQYRAALEKRVIEFPAGLVRDMEAHRGESFENAAKRELEEETGYRAGKIKVLFRGPASSGATASMITFFLAEKLTKVSEGGGDETEDIQVHEIPVKKLAGWIQKMEKKGMVTDPKVYSGLYFLEKIGAKRS
ncbi:MAG: NUDIX hydrolase [Candidatus Omnitrophica bacterium]|nr:NUDIX hydrolase [Candidatus Omnitrophota bacterium]